MIVTGLLPATVGAESSPRSLLSVVVTVTFPVVVTGKVWQETSDQSVGTNFNNVQSSVYTLSPPPNKNVPILTVTSDSNRTSDRKGGWRDRAVE